MNKSKFLLKKLPSLLIPQMEIIHYLTNCLILFFVPIILPSILNNILPNTFFSNYSQLFVGTIVNITLIKMAINHKYLLPLLISCALPSLSSLPNGLISTITMPFIYSCYMMPFIWLGNISLILIFRILYKNLEINYFIVGFISLIIKPAIICLPFLILSYGVNLIPVNSVAFSSFLLAMSAWQICTLMSAILFSYQK